VGNCTDISGQVTDSRDWSLPAAAEDDAAKGIGVITGGEEDARRVYENLGRVPEASPVPALFREIFGNPFRPVSLPPSWLAWNDGTIPKLARALYDERAFDRLPILADALEETGCTDAAILGHCRGPGPHVRGCWALDLLLGKS
jgi:hypothetical protein